jgi:hypothetical protein
MQLLGLPDRAVGIEGRFGNVSELETVLLSDTIQSIEQNAEIRPKRDSSLLCGNQRMVDSQDPQCEAVPGASMIALEKVRRKCPPGGQYSKLSTIRPVDGSWLTHNCMRVSNLIRSDWHTECRA